MGTRRLLAVAILILVVAAGAVAQQTAVFEDIRGKVEVKEPGASWQAASEGQEIPLNATLSTGFNSEATLALGRSTVVMKALSRMSVEELVEQEGTVETGVRLDVGRVSAEVRSAEGVQTDFRVRGPISTASVRGTAFDFDTVTLFVVENRVQIQNLVNQSRTVLQEQVSKTGGYDFPENPEREFVRQTITDTTPAAVASGLPQGTRGGAGGRGLGNIIVTVKQ
jgi:hypothetical protein